VKFPSSFYNGAQVFSKCVRGYKAQKSDEDYYCIGGLFSHIGRHSLSYQHMNKGKISSNMSNRDVASGRGEGVNSPGHQSHRDGKPGDKMNILNRKSDFLRSKHSKFLSCIQEN